jgi:hypothetical protein
MRAPGSGLLPCGTAAAYRRHLDHHEIPCQACYEAERIRLSDRRKGAARRAVLAEAVGDGSYGGRAS